MYLYEISLFSTQTNSTSETGSFVYSPIEVGKLIERILTFPIILLKPNMTEISLGAFSPPTNYLRLLEGAVFVFMAVVTNSTKLSGLKQIYYITDK